MRELRIRSSEVRSWTRETPSEASPSDGARSALMWSWRGAQQPQTSGEASAAKARTSAAVSAAKLVVLARTIREAGVSDTPDQALGTARQVLRGVAASRAHRGAVRPTPRGAMLDRK